MISVCRRRNNWLLQNKQVGSGGGTGQALCGWTQNGPQILGTISFAVCGTHWVGSMVSENRNVIAYWFSIFNGVAAVHCVTTHPISSLSSLFSPSVHCVKIPTMEEDLEWAAAAAEEFWNVWAMGWCQTEMLLLHGSDNQPLAEAEGALLTACLGRATGMCHRERENEDPNDSPWNHPWGPKHWESSRDNG